MDSLAESDPENPSENYSSSHENELEESLLYKQRNGTFTAARLMSEEKKQNAKVNFVTWPAARYKFGEELTSEMDESAKDDNLSPGILLATYSWGQPSDHESEGDVGLFHDLNNAQRREDGYVSINDFGPNQSPHHEKAHRCCSSLFKRVQAKERAPQMSGTLDIKQALITLLGTSISLTIISELSSIFGADGNKAYFVLILGSYGALATLLFAAPHAPLSQPRMIYGGHIIAIFIAILFDWISEPSYFSTETTPWLSKELALGLAPGFAITAMQFCGVTHPPAGAIVLVFLTAPLDIRRRGVFFYIPALIGCSILVLIAIIINNVFPSRPGYPRFW